MNENKRIAKNSLVLCIRLIITTFVGLYTTRLVFIELGTDDYGLYAVVGGIVSMMGFLSTAMLATSYRYISVEIGKGDNGNPNKVFNTAFIIHLILALIFIIIAETIGVWYIKNCLNVTLSKVPDTLFVLHFTVIATVFSIASVPFQGLITAKEKFLVRVSIEIIGAFLKLGFVLLLILYVGNKLRAYAIIMAIVIALPSLIFFMYCWIKEKEVVRWNFNKQKSDYNDMFSFTVWIMIGTIAHMSVRQGGALIVNLFFGTVLNAAFGIASQIYNYTMMFVRNLSQAAVPQIMKSHSSGNSERSLTLVYKISKYAFFIMLIPAIPILLSVDSILSLWLKEVPEFTKQFTVLMIINGLIGVLGSGFDAAIQSTGKIKKAQIWYSIIMISTLPIAYLMFALRFPPYAITIVTMVATIINLLVQIEILSGLTDFKVVEYFSNTIKPVFFVSMITVLQVFLRVFFGQDFFDLIIFSFISVVLSLFTVYLVGLTKNEKNIINNYLIKIKLLII